jgi:hypothetical protein
MRIREDHTRLLMNKLQLQMKPTEHPVINTEKGAAEYSADDAVDIGDAEGPDRSKEALIIQRAARRYYRNGSREVPMTS